VRRGAITGSDPLIVCPYYQIRQLQPRGQKPDGPRCRAVQRDRLIETGTARQLCRSGAYQQCQRYVAIHPQTTRPLQHTLRTSTAKRLLSSALWVIGIPLAITLLILLAAWFTEHVWITTQAARLYH
jgi:hypothetical protein